MMSLVRRGSMLLRLLATGVGLLVALGLAEIAVRLLWRPGSPLGQLYFRDAAGQTVGNPGEEGDWLEQALERRIIESLPSDQTVRPRHRFTPGAHFFLCYRDADRLPADWLDDRGCVEVRINRHGLREREELTPENKGVDERRVVCVGDSFTFGWGVPVERCWVRLLESELRESAGDVRTINCGASGAITLDEYDKGLQTRFGAFQPDIVVVTICLNDLVPTSGLCLLGPTAPASGLHLVDLARSAWNRSPLDLDPSLDWVGLLLSLDEPTSTANGLVGHDRPFASLWSAGAPQKAIRSMRDWCDAHKAKLLVILWPFLQGLGPGGAYPFRPLHTLVRGYCEGVGVPFLDVLPSLQDTPAADLWVTPADMHANPRAQLLALPAIARFVAAQLVR